MNLQQSTPKSHSSYLGPYLKIPEFFTQNKPLSKSYQQHQLGCPGFRPTLNAKPKPSAPKP